jgi:hypothetical protein
VTCSKERYAELIDELDENIQGYSFFKFYFSIHKPDPRVVVQFKCFELFKWDLNQELDEELDIDAVVLQWNDEGYAKAFEEAFDEEYCVCRVYEETRRIQAGY